MVKSTRENLQTTPSKAILDGLAKDGGLYVFNKLKELDLASLIGADYQKVAATVFKTLLSDFSGCTLKRLVQITYNDELFKPAPVSIQDVNGYGYLNLYHGNTFAFKDMALSILPKLVAEAKNINEVHVPNLVVTATSGDTGSAALSGFSTDKKNYVIVLYPTVGVSKFQELQMNNFKNDRLHVYAVDGNFDDCQNIVKELFQTVQTKNVQLTSANSINIGRIVPQVAYYVYTYVTALAHGFITENDSINFCVPTGNFGNIYAAYLANKLGVPVHKLIIASNKNDVIHQFFETGEYKIERTLHKTMSPSMDIIISSNLERYIYDVLGGNYQKLKQKMTELKSTGVSTIEEVKNQDLFYSNATSEEETLDVIQSEFKETGILLDPHTAVARGVYEKYKEETEDDTYTVIVSTASPFKFSDSVQKALGLESGDLLDDIKQLAEYTNTPLDERVLETLKTSKKKEELKKEDALSFLKKVIGDIDENQNTGY